MTTQTVLGALRLDPDGAAVRLERRYATTVEDLWAALVEPDRLARWLSPVEGAFQVGGEVRILFDPDEIGVVTVQECRRPHYLVLRWTFPGENESLVWVELRPDGAAAVLVCDHSRLGASSAGYGAGWQVHLAWLGVHLGEPGELGDFMTRWRELKPAYDGAWADVTGRAPPRQLG